MQMNLQIRQELTDLLAIELEQRARERLYGAADVSDTEEDAWKQVARDAMDFIYGEEASEAQGGQEGAPEHQADSAASDQRDYCSIPGCGCLVNDPLDGVPGRNTLTGVIDPKELLVQRFVASDPRLLPGAPDPAPGSGTER